MPVVLDAQGLHRAYGPHIVLADVSLTIGEGERLGLVGVNGSGKSTLARILAGLEAPDAGALALRRGARVVYLPQFPALDPARTAREEVIGGLAEWRAALQRHQAASAALAAAGAGDALDPLLAAQARAAADVERLGGWELEHRATAVLGHLGLRRLDAPFGALSGGEQRRVALARVLVAAPDLAVLDEPTNHLDMETVEWLERHLGEEHRGAVLLITHDRAVLDSVAQRILELDRGTLHVSEGGYAEYLAAKAERLTLEARVEANRQSFIRQELEWLRRQPRARTTKQKARVQRAEEAIAAPHPPRLADVRLALEGAPSGKRVLEVQQLRLVVAGRTLVDGLDLSLGKGQRLGVIGPNGCGKTTLLRTLIGELAPAAGSVVLGKHTRLAYLGQLRDGLDPQKTILENVADDADHVVVGDQAVDARAYLDRFAFPADRLRQPVSALSGGERTRVALAKLLHHAANLVLLDEPANDLDLPTVAALEQLLLEFDGAALVVTHDRWFLDHVATGLLVFEGEGRVVAHAGGYTDYRARRVEQAARSRATEERGREHAAARRASRPVAALTYAERLELAAIVEPITVAEARVAALEGRLADPETYRDRAAAARLAAELEEARAGAQRLLARWEELESKGQGGAG